MFERFTERARKTVVLAQDEARRLRHDYIGTEHLLLGLIREEEGVAAQALHACGATLDGVREQVEAVVGYGDEEPGSQAPFTPRSKKVLELALREALQLGHNYIGTEHLLLGQLLEREGVAAIALSNLGVDAENVRKETLSRIGGGTRFQTEANPSRLGWAREALQRSFGRYPGAEDRASFKRFTERARKVVVLAQDEARHFNHNYIGTEHILLGLIREERGIASHALKELGVHLDEVREQVESIVGYGEEGSVAQAPFTPRTNKVLKLALRESIQLGHDYVGTEHILLGLVREGEGVAARVLSNLGVDPDEVRREVIRRLPGRGPEPDPFDEVGQKMEEEESGRLFRGRVKVSGVNTTIDGRARTLLVELDYAYDVSDTGDSGSVVDHEGLTARVSRVFEGQELSTIEDGISKVGAFLPNKYPFIEEITVSATVAFADGRGLLSEFTVVKTFRR